jgi:hypothetical protein
LALRAAIRPLREPRGSFSKENDGETRGTISITLEDVTLRTALYANCDSIGCRWRAEGNRLVVEALPPDPSRGKTWVVASSGRTMPSGMQFEKTPVREVFDAIAVVAGEGFE